MIRTDDAELLRLTVINCLCMSRSRSCVELTDDAADISF